MVAMLVSVIGMAMLVCLLIAIEGSGLTEAWVSSPRSTLRLAYPRDQCTRSAVCLLVMEVDQFLNQPQFKKPPILLVS